MWITHCGLYLVTLENNNIRLDYSKLFLNNNFTNSDKQIVEEKVQLGNRDITMILTLQVHPYMK